MTTLETTISMIKTLPEADLVKIQNFTKKLSRRREAEAIDQAMAELLPKKSAEEIYADLARSRQQAAEGKCQDAEEFLAELRVEYGF